MPRFKTGDIVYTSIWTEKGPFVVRSVYVQNLNEGWRSTLDLRRDEEGLSFYVLEETCILWSHYVFEKVLGEVLDE